MDRRTAWIVALVVTATALSSVAAAVLLGATSPPRTFTVAQITLTPSGFASQVTPGGTYYFNITARSSYHTDTTRVFIVVTVSDTCADLSSRGFALAVKSATYGGYALMTGVEASGSCTFTNVGISATLPADGVPVVYWFRETVTSTLPDLSWTFQAARQN
ncbi:MAG TPA: hypothetical protein VF992_06100 [Thermoplasmata archaeon]